MAIEPKEWNLGTRRLREKKSGGIHVYINSTTLEILGIKAGDLEYNQCALDNKKVLLKLRKVKK